MDRLRELVISGKEVKEINDINHHISSLSEINLRTGELLAVLDELKTVGVGSVVHVDQNDKVVKLKGSDMIQLAMERDATFEKVKGGFLTKISMGNASVEAVLNPVDVFNIEREKNAFMFSGAGLKARDLYEFMEHLGTVDSQCIEHYLYNGDFDTWLVSINKKGLATSFKRVQKKGLLGDELRSKLIETTKNYVKGQVKKEVKAKIKKEIKDKLLSAMEDL